jgi:hypothetical protein
LPKGLRLDSREAALYLQKGIFLALKKSGFVGRNTLVVKLGSPFSLLCENYITSWKKVDPRFYWVVGRDTKQDYVNKHFYIKTFSQYYWDRILPKEIVEDLQKSSDYYLRTDISEEEVIETIKKHESALFGIVIPFMESHSTYDQILELEEKHFAVIGYEVVREQMIRDNNW